MTGIKWVFTLYRLCHNKQGGTDTHQAVLPVVSQNDYTLPKLQHYILTLIENMFIAYLHLASNVFFELCLLFQIHTHTCQRSPGLSSASQERDLGASALGRPALVSTRTLTMFWDFPESGRMLAFCSNGLLASVRVDSLAFCPWLQHWQILLVIITV